MALNPKSLIISDDIVVLWRDFAKTLGGYDILKNAYGGHWPRLPVKNERVISWYDDEILVGWSSVRRDPVESYILVSIGIFPKYFLRGYSVEVFARAVTDGFETFPDVKCVLTSILKKNDTLVKHHFDLTKKYTWWKYAGEILLPYSGEQILFGTSRIEWFGRHIK
jgi:hypothetical protein